MDHVAIMKKSWGLIPKIISGDKVIESRWYKLQYAPWGRIGKGDTIYFKNSGERVSVRAGVDRIISFSNLDPKKVKEILNKYGEKDGIEKGKIKGFFSLFKDRKYCLLIFLKNPQKIKPFEINKKGFGAMSAWMCVGKIGKVKIK